MSDLSAIIIINKTKEAVMQDNNIEDDSSEVYVSVQYQIQFKRNMEQDDGGGQGSVYQL